MPRRSSRDQQGGTYHGRSELYNGLIFSLRVEYYSSNTRPSVYRGPCSNIIRWLISAIAVCTSTFMCFGLNVLFLNSTYVSNLTTAVQLDLVRSGTVTAVRTVCSFLHRRLTRFRDSTNSSPRLVFAGFFTRFGNKYNPTGCTVSSTALPNAVSGNSDDMAACTMRT
jgi:hypothetical protein